MSDGADPRDGEASNVPAIGDTDKCSVEAYETEGGTVLYDAWNPLAWIESTVAITVDEAI